MGAESLGAAQPKGTALSRQGGGPPQQGHGEQAYTDDTQRHSSESWGMKTGQTGADTGGRMQAGSEPRSPATSTRSNSSECPQPPTWEVPPPWRNAGTGRVLAGPCKPWHGDGPPSGLGLALRQIPPPPRPGVENGDRTSSHLAKRVLQTPEGFGPWFVSRLDPACGAGTCSPLYLDADRGQNRGAAKEREASDREDHVGPA